MKRYSTSAKREVELENMNVFHLLNAVAKEIDENFTEEREVLIPEMLKVIEQKIEGLEGKDKSLAQCAFNTYKFIFK